MHSDGSVGTLTTFRVTQLVELGWADFPFLSLDVQTRFHAHNVHKDQFRFRVTLLFFS